MRLKFKINEKVKLAFKMLFVSTIILFYSKKV